MKKLDYLILAILVTLALLARLYKIDTPLADLHSFRQVDTAAVARNYVRSGINLMRPVYDDQSNIQTGFENPQGLRFVEFPLYNALIALFARYVPVVTLEIWGRLISVGFSLITLAILYYFALKEKNRTAAVATGLVYGLFPFIVFFSRVVLPETTAIAHMMIGILLVYHGVKKGKNHTLLLTLGGVFVALSILIKPTTIFYGITVLYLFISAYKFDIFKTWRFYYVAALCLIPFVLWRGYITQFPEGIPASSWLFSTVHTFEGPKDILFRPAFFRWIFMERIGAGMMGMFGSAFLLMGLVSQYKKLFIPSIILSGFAFLFTFQGGNVQHEYYQTILFPAIALATGVGIAQFLKLPKSVAQPFVLYPLVVVFFLFSIAFSYYKIKDYYSYPQDLPKIAELVRIFTKPTDRIVTDRLGDTTLLYLMDRKGAPAIYKELPELKEMGYNYIVTLDEEKTTKYQEEGYEVVIENELFSLIRL